MLTLQKYLKLNFKKFDKDEYLSLILENVNVPMLKQYFMSVLVLRQDITKAKSIDSILFYYLDKINNIANEVKK